MQMTYGDQMKALGREEGRQEGKKSMQELVLRLLADRFGQVSNQIRDRVR